MCRPLPPNTASLLLVTLATRCGYLIWGVAHPSTPSEVTAVRFSVSDGQLEMSISSQLAGELTGSGWPPPCTASVVSTHVANTVTLLICKVYNDFMPCGSSFFNSCCYHVWSCSICNVMMISFWLLCGGCVHDFVTVGFYTYQYHC